MDCLWFVVYGLWFLYPKPPSIGSSFRLSTVFALQLTAYSLQLAACSLYLSAFGFGLAAPFCLLPCCLSAFCLSASLPCCLVALLPFAFLLSAFGFWLAACR